MTTQTQSSRTTRSATGDNTVLVSLGALTDLDNLFGIPGPLSTRDVVRHALNQTLLRDGFNGAWTLIYDDPKSTQNLLASITSPSEDVSAYATAIPAWLAAAKTAYGIYTTTPSVPAGATHFLLPFGLSLARPQSIQLLHYPPTETMSYVDYLYSPTNRRWESLLGYNQVASSELTLLESIVDIVPVAADGGTSGGKAVAIYNQRFGPYIKQMVPARLDGTLKTRTQPVVAYGGPVRDWLESTDGYCSVIAEQLPDRVHDGKPSLEVLDVFELQFFGTTGPSTPVLIANHPSEFIEMNAGSTDRTPTEVLTQDLCAARWQAQMAGDWNLDYGKTRDAAREYWEGQPALVAQILATQEAEFRDPSDSAAATPGAPHHP